MSQIVIVVDGCIRLFRCTHVIPDGVLAALELAAGERAPPCGEVVVCAS